MTKTLASALRVAAFGTMLIGASAAYSQELLVENSPDAEPTIKALMEPLSPFIKGTAQTTTSISQIGEANRANAATTGASNFAAIAQAGSNNNAVQAIEGSSSAMLLVQNGTNNNVIQASQGNRNFQAVGVSGNNNDVAYLQQGNDLAGALDVRGNNNSSFLVVQTNNSSRYLMPVGLHGLNNAVVVMVPGRMYVVPKK